MEETAVVVKEVARLADAALIAGLQRWVRADRTVTTRMLVHLGEVDARALYRERAWSSMFAYAVGELHMSESEACVRIAAARLGRRFPRVVELVAEGAVHLTAIKLLGPHLTEDNHLEVLERARGRTAREVERLVAELAPKPDVPSRMRKLPARASAHATQLATTAQSTMTTASSALSTRAADPSVSSDSTCAVDPSVKSELTVSTASGGIAADSPVLPNASPQQALSSASVPLMAATAQPADGASRGAIAVSVAQLEGSAPNSRTADARRADFQLEPAPRRVSSITPRSPGRYLVEFTVGEAMHSTLEQLKALLRHQIPNQDLATILERAADLLLAQTLKTRFAQPSRPRDPKPRNGDLRAATARESHARASDVRESDVRENDARENDVRESNVRENDARASDVRENDARESNVRESDVRASNVRERDVRECVESAQAERAISALSRVPIAGTACTGEVEARNDSEARASGAACAMEHAEARGGGTASCEARQLAGATSLMDAHPSADTARGHSHSRYIPRSVVREVYARDGGQCTFVSRAGKRCCERSFLELHHVVPYAHGGAATAENVRTVCRAHNALFAEHDFGKAFMQSKQLQSRLHVGGGAHSPVLRQEHE